MINDELLEDDIEESTVSFIQIDDNLRLLMTARNWQLQKKLIAQSDTKHQKAGDISWVSFNWFTSINSALKTIIHIKTSKKYFNDMQSFMKANEEAINEIKQAIYPDYEIVEVKNAKSN